MKTVLYPALVTSYVLSCVACSFAPRAGLVCLLSVGALVSLPYFVVQASKGFLFGVAVSTACLIVSILVPPLAFVVLVWGAVSIILKIGRFFRNVPLILAGILLYGVATFVPHAAFLLISSRLPSWAALALTALVPMTMGLLGYLAIRGMVNLFGRCGYPHAHCAAVMLGFTSYLFIFFVMLLIPIDADGGDAEGFDWDD